MSEDSFTPSLPYGLQPLTPNSSISEYGPESVGALAGCPQWNESKDHLVSSHIPEGGWCHAKQVWGVHWQVFQYSMALLHGVLLLWMSINIGYLLCKKCLLSRWYFITLSSMVVIFSASRVTFFAVDPYNTLGWFTLDGKGLDAFLFNLSFPCLTVSFYVLFAAQYHTLAEPDIIPPYIFSKWALLAISVFNFLVSIGTDVVLTFVQGARVMMLVCQMVYVLWGIIFFLLYLYLFCQLYGKIIRVQAKQKKKTCYLRGGSCANRAKDQRMPLSLKVSLVAAAFFLASALLNLYSLLGELGTQEFSVRAFQPMTRMQTKPWPFFTFRLLFVLCELCMALTMGIVSTQPLKKLKVQMLIFSTKSVSTSDDSFGQA